MESETMKGKMAESHRNVRNGSVEVLRCLLMFLIVLYHSWYYGLFGYEHGSNACHAAWTLVFSALIVWHVDGFVAISGWFGIKLTGRKFFSLYALILFYSVLSCALCYFTTGRVVWSVSGGWFGGSYLMLMLCAPILNASIEHLARDRKLLLSSWGMLAIGVTLTWLPKHLFMAVAPRGVYACSFFTLLFVYCTARTCRCVLADKIVPLSKLACVLGLLPVGMLVIGGSVAMWKCVFGNTAFAWSMFAIKIDYLSPFVWVVAIAIFVIFLWHLHFPTWIENLCRWMVPSLFAIYLIHDVMFSGHDLYLIPQRKLYAMGFHPFVCIVGSGIVAFCAGVIIDGARRLLKYAILMMANGTLAVTMKKKGLQA